MSSPADNRIVLLQSGYLDLQNENAELKTQNLEKTEYIAQLRRQLNASNNKVAKLQQLMTLMQVPT
jgi:hypothetical protein